MIQVEATTHTTPRNNLAKLIVCVYLGNPGGRIFKASERPAMCGHTGNNVLLGVGVHYLQIFEQSFGLEPHLRHEVEQNRRRQISPVAGPWGSNN